ncbi:hypothetical protein PHAVU_010G060150 [Phaseolus vulgaris]
MIRYNSFDHIEVVAAAEIIKPPSCYASIPLDDIGILKCNQKFNWPWTTHMICKPNQLYSLSYEYLWCLNFHTEARQILNCSFGITLFFFFLYSYFLFLYRLPSFYRIQMFIYLLLELIISINKLRW